jgi:hypothetical protein
MATTGAVFISDIEELDARLELEEARAQLGSYL